MMDLLLIRVLLTDPVFGPRSMVYLTDLSSAILIALRNIIAVWHKSVGRQIMNPSTLNQ